MSVTDERLREILAEQIALTSPNDAADIMSGDETWRLTEALKAMRRAIAEDRAGEKDKGPGKPTCARCGAYSKDHGKDYIAVCGEFIPEPSRKKEWRDVSVSTGMLYSVLGEIARQSSAELGVKVETGVVLRTIAVKLQDAIQRAAESRAKGEKT